MEQCSLISHMKDLVIRDGNTAIYSVILPMKTPYYLHYVRDTLGNPHMYIHKSTTTPSQAERMMDIMMT